METFIYLTLGGSAMALLLLIIGKFFSRKLPAGVYYYAWLLVLLRFVVPLPGLVPINAARSSEPVQTPDPVSVIEVSAQESVPETEATEQFTFSDIGHGTVPAADHEEHFADTVTGAPSADGHLSARSGINLRSVQLWTCIWAAGAAISFSVCILSYMSFAGKISHGLTEPDLFTLAVYTGVKGRKPILYMSDAVRTPMMFGMFSPKIVLPERKYSDEELRNILMHEVMHFRRKDTLYKWFSVLVLSTQWVNPLAYIIRREINRSCELSCDEMLLRSMNRDEK